jgi:dTDP-4-dehydrorhamnose reductase
MTGFSALVIGRTGQLALSLAERARGRPFDLEFAGRPELDLLDHDSIRRTVARSRAAVIVNTAAYTAVDRAEDEPELAHQVNAIAPRILAEAARDSGARLIHLSTDYVFDGTKGRPWKESDPTRPASVYGRTKLEGELAVREALSGHVILRTAWLYSPFGRNFVTAMLALARSRATVEVVADQIGNPSCALDLADGILSILAAWNQRPDRGVGATYHLAGTGAASWADFARAIFASSRAGGGPCAAVKDIPASQWPARAARPPDSRLDCGLFRETFGFAMPPWRESLAEMVPCLLAFGEAAAKV